MADISNIIPQKESKWFTPFEEFPEFQIEIAFVDAKRLDVLASRSKVKVRYRNEKGRFEEKEEYSLERAARAYASEVFVNFKGLYDGDKEIPNTIENRVMLLLKSQTLFNFVIDVAHSEANFVEEARRESEKSFFSDSESLQKDS